MFLALRMSGLFTLRLLIIRSFFLNCKLDWTFPKESLQDSQRNKNNKKSRLRTIHLIIQPRTIANIIQTMWKRVGNRGASEPITKKRLL